MGYANLKTDGTELRTILGLGGYTNFKTDGTELRTILDLDMTSRFKNNLRSWGKEEQYRFKSYFKLEDSL